VVVKNRSSTIYYGCCIILENFFNIRLILLAHRIHTFVFCLQSIYYLDTTHMLLVMAEQKNFKKIGLLFLFCLSWQNSLLLQYQAVKRKRAKQKRRWWVRPVNKLRNAQGFYHNLVQELLQSDHEEFFGLYRMWPEQFSLLINLLHPYIKKNSNRTPLPTELRLAVTLL